MTGLKLVLRILLILVSGTLLSVALGLANYHGGELWLFRNPIIAACFGGAIGYPAAFVIVLRIGKSSDDD
jgi:hypothetical protein